VTIIEAPWNRFSPWSMELQSMQHFNHTCFDLKLKYSLLYTGRYSKEKEPMLATCIGIFVRRCLAN
jgi:hypothetical protein